MPLDLNTIVKRTVLIFAVLALILIAFVAKFESFGDPNVADYAQIARHLARGEGFTTSAISPLSLAIVPRLQRHPELARPPLYPCFLALAMLMGGTTDRAVALTSTIFLLATLLLTYSLARRCFSDQVGVFAVVICVLTVPLLAQAVSGADTALLTLLVTLLFGVLFWREASSSGRDGLGWPVASGLALGLCYLTRYETAALLPAVLLYYFLGGGRRVWPRLALVLLCFLLIALPWVVRCSLVTGRPFVSLHSYELVMFTSTRPMQTLYRTFADVPPSPRLAALQRPQEMLTKLSDGLALLYGAASQWASPLVFPFFLVGIVLAATRRRYALLHGCLLLALACQAVVLCFYMPLSRLLLPFTPAVAILATSWFSALADDYAVQRAPAPDARLLDRWRLLALLAWMTLVGLPMLRYLFATPAAREHPVVGDCRRVGQQNANLIATDLPWFVAWYGEKTSLLLPQRQTDLDALARAGLRPDCIYLSPAIMNLPPAEGMAEWQARFTDKDDFDGFRRLDEPDLLGVLWESRTNTPAEPPPVPRRSSERGH